MALKVVSPVTVEPVTLAQAKLHLRVDGSDEDTLITGLISAARAEAEHITGRSIGEQVLQLLLDEFPDGPVQIPAPPLVGIDYVQYIDTNGDTQLMSPADYATDDASLVPWLVNAYGQEWPATLDAVNAVLIQYRAGYSECPAPLRSWILMRVGSLYAHREADAEKPVNPLQFVDRLLDGYRVPNL
jgi:uncharacterized phiE125 gp8 family phage protein